MTQIRLVLLRELTKITELDSLEKKMLFSQMQSTHLTYTYTWEIKKKPGCDV